MIRRRPDSSGDPLFVVTAPASAGLFKMLPGILDQIRRLVRKRLVSFVFNRGGFSPKLFQQIIAAGFGIQLRRRIDGGVLELPDIFRPIERYEVSTEFSDGW
jgi:hypothetical protein